MNHAYEILEDYQVPLLRVDLIRYQAFCELLNQKDPKDLPPRRTREPIAGNKNRFKKWLTILMLATRERIITNYKRTWWELDVEHDSDIGSISCSPGS